MGNSKSSFPPQQTSNHNLKTASFRIPKPPRRPPVIPKGELEIRRFLEKDPTLTILDLYGLDLGPDVGVKLAEGLISNQYIRSLYLSQNAFGNLTAERIGNVLGTNQTLDELYLAENSISDITTIATALETNCTLKRLDLGGNQLTGQSYLKLAEHLKHNTTLKYLDLAPTGGSFDSISKQFFSILRNNTSLWKLKVGSNPEQYEKETTELVEENLQAEIQRRENVLVLIFCSRMFEDDSFFGQKYLGIDILLQILKQTELLNLTEYDLLYSH